MSEHGVISLQLKMGGRSDGALQASQRNNNFSLGQPADFALIHLMRLALAIESDSACVEDWYWSEPIREFGGLTAQQLGMV